MQWSRLKKQVKERLSPKLAGRVDLHSTQYRWHHEADGRIWITVDGAELVSFCTQTHRNRSREIAEELLGGDADEGRDEQGSWSEALGAAAKTLNRKGQLTRWRAREDLESYLGMAVEDALEAESPILVGLAVLDRRLGKRRLRELELPARAPSFVSELLELRLDAEGMAGAGDTPVGHGITPAG